MKTIKLPANVTRTIGKATLTLKKHSPEILVVTGVVGMVTSAVLACKATTQISTIIDNAKETVDKINTTENGKYTDVETGDLVEYNDEIRNKDLAITYIQTGLKVAKLYAPSVVLGSVSIGAVFAGHHILSKRNVALAAAYTAVDRGFKDYRKNVIERFGEELDKELRYNVKAEKVTVIETDENGKEKKVKKTINVAHAIPSEFAKCFDESCRGWHKDPEANLMFLRRQQDQANELLQSKGWLSLNQAYELLGFNATRAGQVMGWVYDENDPDSDTFVDFGIYQIDREENRDFVNGLERSIWLDFNVVNIMNKVEKMSAAHVY